MVQTVDDQNASFEPKKEYLESHPSGWSKITEFLLKEEEEVF